MLGQVHGDSHCNYSRLELHLPRDAAHAAPANCLGGGVWGCGDDTPQASSIHIYTLAYEIEETETIEETSPGSCSICSTCAPARVTFVLTCALARVVSVVLHEPWLV